MKITLFALSLALILIFPKPIFSVLAGVMIILVVLFLIIELGLDIYIIAKILIQHYKDKREDKMK